MYTTMTDMEFGKVNNRRIHRPKNTERLRDR